MEGLHQAKEKVIEALLHFLNQLPPEFIIIFISCFPVLELRGAIPIALSVFHMPFWEAYVLSVIGNMLPVLPLLFLFQPLSNYLVRFVWYKRFYDWLYERTLRRGKDIQKYGAIGLILFTAVPLPTTGAWTACLAASFFKIRIRYAFVSIFIGVIIAGMLMGIFSYSIFG
jgi:uncharacterized membrane protein